MMWGIALQYRPWRRYDRISHLRTTFKMQITLSNEVKDETISIEISEDITLEDFTAYVEAETGIPAAEQLLIHNHQTMLGMQRTLKEFAIQPDDIVLLRSSTLHVESVTEPQGDLSDRAEVYRQHILQNPHVAEQLRTSYPQLHSKLHDAASFRAALLQLMPTPQNDRNAEIMRLQQNPDDPESQSRILELIRQEQIEENLQLAYDISPESFVSVTFLYIKLTIKGHEAYALVDSGAQLTIIHPDLAEKFGILNLVDKRFASMTVGVGSQQSQGRIHSVPVSLGDTNVELPCSFTVLETHVGILFGLDMLRRHKCNIDLAKDALIIGGQEVKFMSESEIEKKILPLQVAEMEKLKQKMASGEPSVVTAAPTAPTAPPTASGTRLGRAESSTESSAGLDRFPESDISQLTSLGFSRVEATNALRATGGSVEMAASLLFQ